MEGRIVSATKKNPSFKKGGSIRSPTAKNHNYVHSPSVLCIKAPFKVLLCQEKSMHFTATFETYDILGPQLIVKSTRYNQGLIDSFGEEGMQLEIS